METIITPQKALTKPLNIDFLVKFIYINHRSRDRQQVRGPASVDRNKRCVALP